MHAGPNVHASRFVLISKAIHAGRVPERLGFALRLAALRSASLRRAARRD
jgi:hypothetical protein